MVRAKNAPVPRTLGRIMGAARVGKVVRCRPASFLGATKTTVQWLRNGRLIRRATHLRYRVARPDLGRVLSCRSTAVGAGGRTSVVSFGVLVRG